MSEQELLDRYVAARRFVICETSSDIIGDFRTLVAEVDAYVAEHGRGLNADALALTRTDIEDADEGRYS